MESRNVDSVWYQHCELPQSCSPRLFLLSGKARRRLVHASETTLVTAGDGRWISRESHAVQVSDGQAVRRLIW